MSRFGKIVRLVAAAVACLAIVSHSARAQNYVVNGHAASPAETLYLASLGAVQGEWSANGFGVSRVAEAAVQKASHKCWFVLDVQLCDDDVAAPSGAMLVASSQHSAVRQSSAEPR